MNAKEFRKTMSTVPAVAALRYAEREALERAVRCVAEGWERFEQTPEAAQKVLEAVALVESHGVVVDHVIVSRVSWGGYPFATKPRETLAARLVAWEPDGENVTRLAPPVETDGRVAGDRPWRDLED